MIDPRREAELRRWQRERKREQLAEEAEKQQQEMRHREQEAAHRRRLAALEQQWEWFKARDAGRSTPTAAAGAFALPATIV
jgi:hypothetical protein